MEAKRDRCIEIPVNVIDRGVNVKVAVPGMKGNVNFLWVEVDGYHIVHLWRISKDGERRCDERHVAFDMASGAKEYLDDLGVYEELNRACKPLHFWLRGGKYEP
jgi:hypothetical protein